jgi:hypothetical protein
MNDIRKLNVEELIPKNIYILTIFQDGIWLCQYSSKEDYNTFMCRFYYITGKYNFESRNCIIPLMKDLIYRSYLSRIEKSFLDTVDHGFYHINQIHNYKYLKTRYKF